MNSRRKKPQFPRRGQNKFNPNIPHRLGDVIGNGIFVGVRVGVLVEAKIGVIVGGLVGFLVGTNVGVLVGSVIRVVFL